MGIVLSEFPTYWVEPWKAEYSHSDIASCRNLAKGAWVPYGRAEHLGLRAQVAVKLIDADIVHSEEALRRFEREAQAAAAIRSNNIVQILDYGVDDQVPYIAR
jgi:serine/threonine-protein kinase